MICRLMSKSYTLHNANKDIKTKKPGQISIQSLNRFQAGAILINKYALGTLMFSLGKHLLPSATRLSVWKYSIEKLMYISKHI